MTTTLTRTGRQALWQDLLALRRATGSASSAARMQPDFLVVGAQRCGTTSLFRQLRAHPHVLTSRLVKGVHYFDVHYDRPWRWYLGHFPLRVSGRVAGAGRRALTGEASPYYLFHPLAAARIARALPEVRLVAILRDPVARAWSHYQHEVARGFETRPFGAALDAEPEMLVREEARLLAEPLARSHAHQHHAYVARGRYAAQLERLWTAVPPSRLLVLASEDLFRDHRGTFLRLCDFLGLPAWAPERPLRLNARSYDRLDPGLRRRLREELRDDTARLVAATGVGGDWDG
jgi:hypothetical protein